MYRWTFLHARRRGRHAGDHVFAANFRPRLTRRRREARRRRRRPGLLASPKAADVVDAADAFLATLSDKQRAIAQIELKPSSPSGGRTFRVGPMSAMASSTASSSPSRSRRP